MKMKTKAKIKMRQMGFFTAIGLVLLSVSACAPSAGPYNQRNYTALGVNDKTLPNNAQPNRVNLRDYSPAGISDPNPVLVPGKNDVFNVTLDAHNLRRIALSVKGVESAEVRLHGSTAHINIHVNRPTARDVQKVKSRVYHQIKMNMPQYKLDIVAR
jgi:hypothetical protein